MRRLIAKSEKVNLNELIREARDFDNWTLPDLQKEYNVEYKHHIIYDFGDIWPTFEDFSKAVDNAEQILLTPEMDHKISNRSYTTSMDELIQLVSSYRSWPEFRNEETLQAIIEGFVENRPMEMPIVINDNGYMRIMSGNTRLDIAFMMQVQPQVVIINI